VGKLFGVLTIGNTVLRYYLTEVILLTYDEEFWDDYTNLYESHDSKGIADFIYHTCLALNAKIVCEIGCNVGNNLQSFPEDYLVWGCDRNTRAIQMAMKSIHVRCIIRPLVNTRS